MSRVTEEWFQGSVQGGEGDRERAMRGKKRGRTRERKRGRAALLGVVVKGGILSKVVLDHPGDRQPHHRFELRDPLFALPPDGLAVLCRDVGGGGVGQDFDVPLEDLSFEK